jgi:UDP-N-acetylmuramoyl-tripeptide--D-alanyl-D-alanine ligase
MNKMNFLSKLKFLIKKPKVIIVLGSGRACAKEAIFQVLKPHFQIGKEILLFESELKDLREIKKFKFYIKNSRLPILVVTHIGDIPFDKEFFAGERKETTGIRKLAKILPVYGHLILNFDDETVREIKDETNLKELTFGFQEGADFRVTDINLNSGTNFKINYEGNIVPVWLEKLFGKEQIYSALSAAAVGKIFNLNLVEISQALKNYYSLPGKMRLIKSIKNSMILDDSESATVFSMIEAIEILGKIQGPEFHRRIAVLGDVMGIGKYTAEAHEAIGERVARNSDLLFTFGQRAHFIAQGAENKGMTIEKIFKFNTIDEGKSKLKDETQEGDLILVDGSKEMEMGEIVEEIKSL